MWGRVSGALTVCSLSGWDYLASLPPTVPFEGGGWVSPLESSRSATKASKPENNRVRLSGQRSPWGESEKSTYRTGQAETFKFPRPSVHPADDPSPTSSLVSDLTTRLQSLADIPPSPPSFLPASSPIHIPGLLSHHLVGEPSSAESPVRSPSPPMPTRVSHRRSSSPVDRSRPLGTDGRRGRTREPKVLWRSDVPDDDRVMQDRMAEVRTMEWVKGRGEDKKSREGWSRGLSAAGL